MGEGKKLFTYVVCICQLRVIEDSYERLKEDVLEYKQKGRVVLLGDFNARVLM